VPGAHSKNHHIANHRQKLLLIDATLEAAWYNNSFSVAEILHNGLREWRKFRFPRWALKSPQFFVKKSLRNNFNYCSTNYTKLLSSYGMQIAWGPLCRVEPMHYGVQSRVPCSAGKVIGPQ